MNYPPQVGELVAGKYRVERQLGEGGIGFVLMARHTELDKVVALKLLHPHLSRNPQLVQRFAREARAAAKLRSRHVAQVLDVGTLEQGAPYMVMEFLHGEDLSDRLTRVGKLPPAEAVDVLLQTCEAVAEAHAAGIIHRDLKPANLFLAEEAGEILVKVLDFGISKMREGDSSLTASATVIGTPLYMSPEQMHSARNVDERSDVWALGVILYELLSGTTPFTGETMPELCLAVVSKPHPRLLDLQPELPPGLCAVVDDCLSKPLELRVKTVAELAQRLAPFGSGKQAVSIARIASLRPARSDAPPALGPAPALEMAATEAHPLGSTSAAVVTDGLSSASPARPQPVPRRWLLPVVAASLGLVAVLGWWALRRGTPSTDAPLDSSAAPVRQQTTAGAAPELPSLRPTLPATVTSLATSTAADVTETEPPAANLAGGRTPVSGAPTRTGTHAHPATVAPKATPQAASTGAAQPTPKPTLLDSRE